MSESPGGQMSPGPGRSVVASDPEPDLSEVCLTVAALARRLGVAPATLRTWDRRYGLGPAAHAPGAHRRYGPADVARLEAMQRALLSGAGPAEAARYALACQPHDEHGVTAERPDRRPRPASGTPRQPSERRTGEPGEPAGPETPPGAPVRPVRVGGRPLRMPGAGAWARGLARAAVALDAAAIGDVLDAALADQGVIATWDLVIRPVLGAVADCWDATGAGVDIEHLLTEGALDAFRDVFRCAPEPRHRRPVLLACVPDELHSLPLYALSAALAQRAVRCRVLGAALPPEALSDAIRRTAPSVVFLWAQMRLTTAGELLAGLPRLRQRFRVLAGGPGWDLAGIPGSIECIDGLGAAVDRIEAAVAVGARGPATTLRS